MREFSSGIVGCIICILALMGSVLGGFCLDIDKETRESTNYNYVTDITGLFDTVNAPKYIDYNPSTNFIGYEEQTVQYVDSSIPNNYRYVADSGLTTVKTFQGYMSATTTPPMVSSPDGGDLARPYFLNYTGTKYNLGTSVTHNEITYNIVANAQDGHSTITRLYDIGLNPGEYNLISSQYPVILYNGTFTSKYIPLYNSIMDIRSFHATIDDNCFPTKISYTEGNVIAYNGTTQLWSANSGDVYVIYDYSIMIEGVSTRVSVNTNFDNGRTFTKTDTTFTSTWTPDTHDIFTRYQNLYLYYIGEEYDFGEERRLDPNDLLTRYNATLVKDPSGTHFCVTPVRSILQTLYGSDMPTSPGWITINIENNGLPFFITGTLSVFKEVGSSAIIASTYNRNVDEIRIYYAGSENYSIQCYKNGSLVTQGNGSNYGIYWAYIPNNQNTTNVNTTFTSRIGSLHNVGTGDSYPFPPQLSGAVAYLPLVAFNYTGNAFDLGSPVTDHGITYNGSITSYRTNYGGTPVTPYLGAYPLSQLLQRYISDVENSVTANFEITYPSTGTAIFFMHNQQWTETSVTIDNHTTNRAYVTTLTDDNVPTRFTLNTQTYWVTMYRGETLLYSDSAANIIVTRDGRSVSGTWWQFASADFKGIIERTGTTITEQPTVTDTEHYPTNTTKFPYIEPDGGSAVASAIINLTNTNYNLGSSSNPSLPTYNITVAGDQIPENSARYYPMITRFSDLIQSIDLSGYSTVTFNLNQTGTYPVLFYTGSWQEITTRTGEHTLKYYHAVMDNRNIPNKIVYICATGAVHLYNNDAITYTSTANDTDVIYRYSAIPSSGATVPATTSCTIIGVGQPIPKYAYMDPSKGITLKQSSTIWKNGYENNDIDMIVVREKAGVTNELTITANTSSITIKIVGNTMSAYITKHDGTTISKTIGTWGACQIHIDASEGTLSLTPLQWPISYTNNVPENSTTITWSNWYNGGDILSLMISSTQQPMRFSITNTTVFLKTYGVVMQDPSIDVNSYFPDYEDWRLNFYSFALVGDSLTVNGQTIAVEDGQKITIVGENGKPTTGTLSNIYVTAKENHTYFTFADNNETVDLGETIDNTVSFSGRWYFTTGLYEGVVGTEDYYDWNVDGTLHATIPQMCLMFIGILIAGLIISKAILKLEIGIIDWIILISATVISLIVAGGNI